MSRKTILLASLLALAPAALLAANEPPPPHHRPHGEGNLFKRLDTNQDSVLTRDEVASAGRLARDFDQIDTDHDGMLTESELRAAGAARLAETRERMAERWKAADQNADGQISKDEATAAMPRLAKRFEALDTNQDGLLSPEEVASGARERMGRRGPPPGRHFKGDPAQR